ncbi:MAG: sialidase family protein, partial [Planctomycetota bacterium]
GRELLVAGSRLRYGREEWEPASIFWDAPDRNDHGHALWFDGSDTIYHFQGLADKTRNVALVMRTSKDNGVSWSKPRMITDNGSKRMPVESVFETKEGYYVIACDKGGSTIWVSRDKGLTWEDPKGRIMGLHQTVVQLNDGRLFCLSRGRNRNGKMPLNISSDMGENWEYSDGEFQPVSWGQRSVLLRLKEGPIFFASFCKDMMITNASGKQHPVTGLFAAVSIDEGKTWPYKRLVTDESGMIVETMNRRKMTIDAYNSEFLGYLSVCQTPDKLIHLIGSRQHYAFNFKWVMAPPPAAAAEQPNPEPRELPVKPVLSNINRPTKIPTHNDWIWEQQTPEGEASAAGPIKIQNKSHEPLRFRTPVSHDFAGHKWGKGFTAEARVQIIKSQPNQRGLDLEVFNGETSRFTITITDRGVYWYEGLSFGTWGLGFNEYTPLVEGLDNTDGMHTYRLAVRDDHIVQIYRDGKLIGVRRGENRTPREPYLQFGAGVGLEALIEYFAYDLEGPLKPAILAVSSAGDVK